MFTVLRNGTPIINAQDMQTAIRFVQSLESSIDRGATHSPFTIVRAPQAVQPAAHLSPATPR